MVEKFFKCRSCDFFCERSHKLKSHLKICGNSETSLQQFRCDLCPFTRKEKKCIILHVITHMKKKPFECKHCGHTFGSKNRLFKHTTKTVPRCRNCDLTFECRILLRNHIKEKHANKFQCEICFESFETQKQSHRHRQNHLKVKVTCEVCYKEFSRNSALKYHQKTTKHGKFALKEDEH